MQERLMAHLSSPELTKGYQRRICSLYSLRTIQNALSISCNHLLSAPPSFTLHMLLLLARWSHLLPIAYSHRDITRQTTKVFMFIADPLKHLGVLKSVRRRCLWLFLLMVPRSRWLSGRAQLSWAGYANRPIIVVKLIRSKLLSYIPRLRVCRLLKFAFLSLLLHPQSPSFDSCSPSTHSQSVGWNALIFRRSNCKH